MAYLPSSLQEILAIEENVKRIEDLTDAMGLRNIRIKEIDARIACLKETAEKIALAGESLKRYCPASEIEQLFASAKEALEAANLDKKSPLLELFAKLEKYEEVVLALICAHDIEAKGERPFLESQVEEWIVKANALDENLFSPEKKKGIIEEFHRHLYLAIVNEENARYHEFRTLDALHKKVIDAQATELAFAASIEAREWLEACYKDEFNELASRYFEIEPDYLLASQVFDYRDLVKKEDILIEAYRDSVDEEEFHLRFLEAKAMRDSSVEFSEGLNEIAEEAKEGQGLGFHAFAAYLALSSIGQEKFQILLEHLAEFPFESEILIFAESMRHGLEEGRQSLVLAVISKRKKKNGDLEKMGDSLLYIKENITKQCRREYRSILGDLLRSPRANKVMLKSASPSLHILFGQKDEEKFPPIGKPLASKRVKSWDIVTSVSYYILMVFLPFIVSVGAMIYLYFSQKLSDGYSSLLMAIPFTIIPLFYFIVVVMHCSNDERPATSQRNVLGLYSLLLSLVALAYFIEPKMFGMLVRFGMGSLIAAFISLVIAFFFLKSKKKRFDYLLMLPTFLVQVAALVFLVFALRNGVIAF